MSRRRARAHVKEPLLAPLWAVMAVVALLPLQNGCAVPDDRRAVEARLLLRQRNVSAALGRLRAVAADSPRAPAHLELGHALMLAQRYHEAEAAYRRALNLVPEDPCPSSRALGQALAHQGRYGEAASVVAACLKATPGDADAQVQLALLRLTQRRSADAAGHLEAALRARPTHPAALYARGRLHLMRGQLGPAAADFERLARAYPERAAGPYGQALVALRQEDATAACAHFTRARARGLRAGLRHDAELPVDNLPPCAAKLWPRLERKR